MTESLVRNKKDIWRSELVASSSARANKYKAMLSEDPCGKFNILILRFAKIICIYK